VDILFAELTPYLGSTIAHDCELQTLLVQNGSFEIGRNQWRRNEVLLRNRATDQWDLIYRFDYPSTTVKQQRGFVGSWGPIVETFQNLTQAQINDSACDAATILPPYLEKPTLRLEVVKQARASELIQDTFISKIV